MSLVLVWRCNREATSLTCHNPTPSRTHRRQCRRKTMWIHFCTSSTSKPRHLPRSQRIWWVTPTSARALDLELHPLHKGPRDQGVLNPSVTAAVTMQPPFPPTPDTCCWHLLATMMLPHECF